MPMQEMFRRKSVKHYSRAPVLLRQSPAIFITAILEHVSLGGAFHIHQERRSFLDLDARVA